jgi:chromosome segregation ATPase
MFVYAGKLNWGTYAKDELLVVILPRSPICVGDTICNYSQWTKDSKGNVKVNELRHDIIDKVAKADNGNDVFYFGRGYYSYKVEAQDGYQTLSFTMSNPAGDKSHMVLPRTHEFDGGEKQIAEFQNQLAASSQKEAELEKRVQALEATLSVYKEHHDENHKVIQNLRSQLEAEKARNAELEKEARDSAGKVAALETETTAIKQTLARTSEELKHALADAGSKDSIIEGLESGMVAMKKDRDANKQAYEQLKKASSATIQELQEEMAKLKAA